MLPPRFRPPSDDRTTLAHAPREDPELIRRSVSVPATLVLLAAWIVGVGIGPAQAGGSVLINELHYLDRGIGMDRPAGTDATSLSNNTTYTFRVNARNTSGYSNPATPATGTPDRLRISGIQGNGATVAIRGSVTVQAIVTALFEDDDLLSGFFLQEETTDSDGDPATSEGIFVHCSTGCPAGLAVGDRVTVVGMAGEFGGASQIDASAGSVTIDSSGNELPTSTSLSLPASGSTRAAETFENVEGMIVTLGGKLVVSEYFGLARYGRLVLTDGSRPYQFTHGHTPSTTRYAAFLADLATRRIILDDNTGNQNEAIFPPEGEDEPYPYPEGGLSNTNRFRGGDSITGMTGVMHWAFGAWRVLPIPERFEYTFAADNPRPKSPEDVGGTLRVASFNVLNYFSTIDDGTPECGPSGSLGCRGADSAGELGRQRDKIAAAMVAIEADIFGVLEIENNPSASLVDLLRGLNAVAGADTYTYVDTGTIGGDAIKVGLIYRPASVTPIGPHAIIDSSVDTTFVDTKNRPGLIQTFEQVATGERFTVAINHFKSKGSDCGGLGDPDLHDGQGNCNGTRTSAAVALARYLATDPTAAGDPDILIMGDLNAYAREDPIRTLEAAGYTDLIGRFVGTGAYSFVFDGRLGYLDHALANESLLGQVTGVTEWHINADEPPLFDYNDGVHDPGERAFQRESTARPIYEANPFRSSDHDPVIIGLHLGKGSSPGPTPTGGVQAVETPFTDLEDASDAHRHNIGRVYGLGITTGTSDTTFSPRRPVSQQQAASFLARMYKAVDGDDAPVVETPFTDLEDASDAHRHNIGRVYGLGIMTGTAHTTFSPLACADRGRMASLLARLHSVLTGDTAAVVATPFTDLDEASSTLSDDIGRIYGLGITTGTSDTTFSPDACTTRQQMASFLVRTYRAATIAGRSSHTSDTEGLDTPE